MCFKTTLPCLQLVFKALGKVTRRGKEKKNARADEVAKMMAVA